jgi:ribose transport system substrate-binding protein
VAAFNQAMNTADLIILEPLISQTFYPLIERAASRGIPTVVVNLTTDTPQAVTVTSNLVKAAMGAGAHTVVGLGGKGNVMRVLGIPGLAGDNEIQGAYDTVLKRCPNIKDVGKVAAGYTVQGAKKATLEFLASHPMKIDGALQSGIMAPGIMSAFQQTGRPMPSVPDMGNMAASLSYWQQHRNSYVGSGSGLGATSLGLSSARVALRMLEGQGVKVNNLVTDIPQITLDNLDAWGPDHPVPLTDASNTEGPKDGFMTDDYMNAFFENPSTPK